MRLKRLNALDRLRLPLDTAKQQQYAGFACPICAQKHAYYERYPTGAVRYYPLDVVQCNICGVMFKFVEEDK
jgi:DNA-directed RNA polymerase subunit M/transcription elongation factor TFIIS